MTPSPIITPTSLNNPHFSPIANTVVFVSQNIARASQNEVQNEVQSKSNMPSNSKKPTNTNKEYKKHSNMDIDSSLIIQIDKALAKKLGIKKLWLSLIQ
jgi:hypothetical protein